MTIVAVATKGRGGQDWLDLEEAKQWVTQYKLATVVDGQVTYYKGPLENGQVIDRFINL